MYMYRNIAGSWHHVLSYGMAFHRAGSYSTGVCMCSVHLWLLFISWQPLACSQNFYVVVCATSIVIGEV